MGILELWVILLLILTLYKLMSVPLRGQDVPLLKEVDILKQIILDRIGLSLLRKTYK
jgi:hypothetical protein